MFKNVVILGATGYIGSSFVRELKIRQYHCISLSRSFLDYTNFSTLFYFLRELDPDFLINAAGLTGNPNVDSCEKQKNETIKANILLPHTISNVCAELQISWLHVSSGCIYSGCKTIDQNGLFDYWRNLRVSEIIELIRKFPSSICGFDERDTPNFTFKNASSSFYSGTKALAESLINKPEHQVYICRLRIPFDHIKHHKNYITKLINYPKIYNAFNSLSHRTDFVKACLDLYEKKGDYGIYNVTNPGYVEAKYVTKLLNQYGLRTNFDYWESDEGFNKTITTPRSNCILDVSKLHKAGVRIRSVQEAIEDSIKNYKKL